MGYDVSTGSGERSALSRERVTDRLGTKTQGKAGLFVACAALSLVATLTGARAVAATATATDATAAPDNSSQVQTVVVTAQKREESLQKVPISADVKTGKTLQLENITGPGDLSGIDPSVHIVQGGAGASVYIRGIGSQQGNVFAPAVGIFVDDVYFPQSRMTLAGFLDESNVEVLKGPQTTYFGNNAIAGALNVVTNKPTPTFDAAGRVLYGSYGTYAAEAAVGGPINDVLSMRIAVIGAGYSGWQKNLYNGQYSGDAEVSARFSLLFKPNDQYDALVKVEEDHLDAGPSYSTVTNCPPSAPFTVSPPPFTLASKNASYCAYYLALGLPKGASNNTFDEFPGQGVKFDQHEVELTQHLYEWGQTFTSVSAFYSEHYQLAAEGSLLPPNSVKGIAPFSAATTVFPYFSTALVETTFNQFSQEFRVASPAGQKFEYLAGVYGQVSHNQNVGLQSLPGYSQVFVPFEWPTVQAYLKATGGSYGVSEGGIVYEVSFSAFASGTYHITDQLQVTGGLRWTGDNKGAQTNFVSGTTSAPYGAVTPFPSSVIAGVTAATAKAPLLFYPTYGTSPVLGYGANVGSSALLPSAVIQYQFTPQIMAYARYDRGYLAGGIGLLLNNTVAPNPYLPEYVDAYEVGIKTQLFGNRVRLNADLFDSEYKDLQVNFTQVINGMNTAEIGNAASATTRGVEGSAEWVISDNFKVSGDVTYDDAHYNQFPGNPLTELQSFCHTATNAANPACVAAFGGLYASAFQNLAGKPTPESPEWTGDVSGVFTTPLPGNFVFTAQLQGIFSSSLNNGADDPLTRVPGYARLDGQLSLQMPDRRWAIDVIGKNLTNATIAQVIAPLGGPPVISPGGAVNGSTLQLNEEPLNVAVQIRFKW